MTLWFRRSRRGDRSTPSLAGGRLRLREGNRVNPLTYSSDVLARIQTHLADGIDDLLLHCWEHTMATPHLSALEPRLVLNGA